MNCGPRYVLELFLDGICGIGWCITSYTHHYSVMETDSLSLHLLCALPAFLRPLRLHITTDPFFLFLFLLQSGLHDALESDHAQPFPVAMFYLVTCIKVTCVFCDLILFYECAPFHSSNTYWRSLSWFQHGSTRYCLMPIILSTIIFSSSTLTWFLSLCGKYWSQVLSLSWLVYPVLEAYSRTFASAYEK